MFRTQFVKPALLGVAITGLLAAGPASPHVGGQANAGYVGDGRGHLVTDGLGKCVRTGTWTPELALAECEGSAKPVAAAAPAPVPPPVAEKITFGADTLFDVDSSALKPAGRQSLDELAARLKGLSSLDGIAVTGYTDSSGSTSYNQELSERRAQAVKDYLVGQGLDGGKISVAGRGEADPVADNGTADGRARNRRVEIDVKATR